MKYPFLSLFPQKVVISQRFYTIVTIFSFSAIVHVTLLEICHQIFTLPFPSKSYLFPILMKWAELMNKD